MNRPFDEAKYQALLEGLEVSEILLSKIFDETLSFRIDSGFFRKEFLHSPLSEQVWQIADKCIVRSGTTPRDRDDSLKDGIILLKTTDIRNNVLSANNEADFYFINHESASTMAKTKLAPDDVLINIVGATTDVIGRVAYVPSSFPKANITQAMALLRLKDTSIKPAFLFAFLSGRYGQQQVRRIARPTGQYNLNLPEVGSFIVPEVSVKMQCEIQEQIELSQYATTQNASLYARAESTFLRVLKLDTWKPPQANSYQMCSSDVFASERLDAEHFHPQYEALLQHLQTHAKRCRFVYEFSRHCDRGIQPEYVENGKHPVVNSRHILETGLDYDNFQRCDEEFWNRIEAKAAHIGRGDVLTYMTGANVGRTAAYLEDELALASNEVGILRTSEENSIYVALALNSFVGRMQTSQAVTGSAQAHLYPKDIKSFIVPFIDSKTEASIVEDVEAAHTARRRAKVLLEAAKSAVEIAIEESEAAGLAYLKNIK